MKQIVSKAGLFLTDVSDAKNSQDLSKVVEKYALPPSSYKMKKASLHSWFINAYVGAYVGAETLTEWSNPSGNADVDAVSGFVYGLTAPIGITYACPPRHKNYNKGYTNSYKHNEEKFYLGRNPWSFTLSLIDIGAVVSYRFNTTQGTLPQDFKWDQFISPGLHIAKGIYNTPLVVSAGVVYTPRIRKVDFVDRQFNAIRVQTAVMFDIPMFKIYTKHRYAKLDHIYD